jgi:Mg2+/Co2+ transporter CorC
MKAADVYLTILGLYLCAGLFVAAWRRGAGRTGGLGLWIASLAAWIYLALPRWLHPAGVWALVTGAAFVALAIGLTGAGMRLEQRSRLAALGWLLGPVHALGLAVTAWIARRPRPAAGPPSPERPEVSDALDSVVELGETTVDDVMIPRSEISALPAGARVRDWAAEIASSGHASIPVYGEDQDEILGYLRLEDLLAGAGPDTAVTEFLREIRFVPETMRCDDLLRELLAHGEPIAIVVDEFGGTAGLVADQDLFEILLGEINGDEPGAPRLVRLSANEYLADGHYRIDDFNERMPAALPEGDYDTLAGLILDRTGRIPEEGERILVDGIRLVVAASSARRVLKVRVAVPARARPAGDA